MKRYKYWFLLLIPFLIVACSGSDDPVIEPPVVLKEGLNYSPTAPDADQELTITFKAGSTSALYNYVGDVYVHIGVIVDGSWKYVPAEWTENISKCKMTKTADNVWSVKLSPTVRQWFASGETSIQKLGIVIRNADGSKKGLTDDAFVSVTD